MQDQRNAYALNGTFDGTPKRTAWAKLLAGNFSLEALPEITQALNPALPFITLWCLFDFSPSASVNPAIIRMNFMRGGETLETMQIEIAGSTVPVGAAYTCPFTAGDYAVPDGMLMTILPVATAVTKIAAPFYTIAHADKVTFRMETANTSVMWLMKMRQSNFAR